MNNILNKIEASFKAAMRGEEDTQKLIWWWGVGGYLVSYFIINRIVRINNIHAVDITISILAIIYFCWHIYVLRKCTPKKPQLTKEEKILLRQERRKEMGKIFMRKLLLQEPITKMNPITVTIILDVFCIAHFLNYVIR